LYVLVFDTGWRHEALNALSIDVLSEPEEAVDSVKIDETRCVIITMGAFLEKKKPDPFVNA
jgi:hypothetical protein